MTRLAMVLGFHQERTMHTETKRMTYTDRDQKEKLRSKAWCKRERRRTCECKWKERMAY